MTRYRGYVGLFQRTAIAVAPGEEGGEPTPPSLPPVPFVAPVVYPAPRILVLVANHRGEIIGRLPCQVDGIAWKLNNTSQARLFAPLNVDPDFIRVGNRILVQADGGLKPWGGELDLPLGREQAGISLTAFKAEILLDHRQTAVSRAFSNATAAEIARALVTEVNAIEFSGVEIGRLADGGLRLNQTYHWKPLFQVITESLMKLAGIDWDVSASEERGRIVFRLNLYEQRGTYKENIWLIEGRNVAPADVNEQGTIVNHWETAGAGSTWGPQDRIYATAEDLASRRRYGLREDSQIFSNDTLQAELDAHALANLAATAEPHQVVSLDGINRSPAPWGEYEVGDWINVDLPSRGLRGYKATPRVVAREYLPASGVLRHVLE